MASQLGALTGSRYLRRKRGTGRDVDSLNAQLQSGVLQRQLAAQQTQAEIDRQNVFNKEMLGLEGEQLNLSRDRLGLEKDRVKQEGIFQGKQNKLASKNLDLQKKISGQQLGLQAIGTGLTLADTNMSGITKGISTIGSKLGIGGKPTTPTTSYQPPGTAGRAMSPASSSGPGFFSNFSGSGALSGGLGGGSIGFGLGQLMGQDKKKSLLLGGLGALGGAALGGFSGGGFLGL